MLLKYTLTLSFLSILLMVEAQPSAIEYVYDAAGNRIQRKVFVMAPEYWNNTNEHQDLYTAMDLESLYEFTLYPNPNEGSFMIEAEEAFLEIDNRRLFVYDARGKLIIDRDFDELRQQIDLPNEATGSYLVRVTAQDGYSADWRILKK